MDLSGFDNPGFNSQAIVPSQANQQAVDVMKKKGNFFTHALPTIGAIGGGILGLPLNLLDAVGIPGTVGDIAAAAGGAAFGKTLENKLEGNSLGSGVVGSAVEGGAGQGLGAGLGFLGGKAGDVVKNYGTDLLSSSGGKILPSEAKAFQLKNTTDTLANYGIKPNEYQDVANKVTGQNGVLTKLTRQAIGNAAPVDTTGIDTLAKQLIANEPLLSGAPEKKVLQTVTNGLDNLNGRGTGFSAGGAPLTKAGAAGTNDVLNAGSNPLDTFDFIKQLESKANSLVGNGKNQLTVSDEAKATANVYKGIADELKDRLFTGSGADAQVANHLITPDVISQLSDIRPGDKNWAQFVQKVMQSQTIGDLRAAQAPFVKGGMIQTAKQAAQQGGSGAGVIVKGGLDLAGLGLAGPTGGASLIPAVAAHTLATDTGKTVVGNFLRDPTAKLPDFLTKPFGAAFKAIPQLLTHATDFTDPNSALPPPDTSPFGHPDNQSVFAQITDNNNSLINDNGQQADDTPGVSGYTNKELQNGIGKAIAAGDIKAATEIQNLLKLNQSSKTGANAPLGQVQKRQLAQINTAVDRLQRVAQDYEGFNIGSGPLGKAGGALKTLEGKVGLNNNVGAYNDQLSDVAMEIARALGGGTGNVSDVRVSQIEKALPKVTDTHEQAVKKINNLLNDLLSAQKEFVSVPSTGGDNVANPNDYTGSSQGFTSNPAQVQFAQ